MYEINSLGVDSSSFRRPEDGIHGEGLIGPCCDLSQWRMGAGVKRLGVVAGDLFETQPRVELEYKPYAIDSLTRSAGQAEGERSRSSGASRINRAWGGTKTA